MTSSKAIRVIFVLVATAVIAFSEGDQETRNLPVPTHADAAVILAKHTGLFDRYVTSEATLTECVAFLNKYGIYFGLMEVVNGKEFTLNDCARVMGQIELVFSGEAEYIAGKVKLPNNIASWEEFCTMSQVNYVEGHKAIVQAMVFAQQLGE